MEKDHFAHKAESYDKELRRTENVTRIADLILREMPCSTHTHLMDFGSGTGLLLERIAPHVKKITAVDISPSMNATLKKKEDKLPCQLQILPIDLTQERPKMIFDGIISSMTIHHVKDVLALFQTFYTLLPKDGTIALADLDTEDGSFHTKDTGVFHFGFDRDWILGKAKEAGFTNLNIQTVGDVIKPYGTYGVFLLTGKK